MKEEIKVPSLGESVTEVTIGTILKSSGSFVAIDEEILELETEKVNQAIYAPSAGKLHLNVSQGEKVPIGHVIGYIDKDDSKPESKPQSSKTESPKEEAPKAQVKTESPKTEPKPTPPPPVPKASSAKETRRKLSSIRKVIAEKMVAAQNTAAMLTTFNEIDMSAVIEIREKHKKDFEEQHKVRLGFMSFFTKAVVEALKITPGLNSYIDGDEIVERHTYDIGIAVGTDRGVIVPVVRNCDILSFADIEGQLSDYATKAKSGKINASDLQGGSFTITNGGVYGSLLSTPILNPPQSGILGMHKIEKRAVVINDQIVIRPMMYVALTYDHRIVDGKEAITFLVHLKELLEDPSRILLDLP